MQLVGLYFLNEPGSFITFTLHSQVCFGHFLWCTSVFVHGILRVSYLLQMRSFPVYSLLMQMTGNCLAILIKLTPLWIALIESAEGFLLVCVCARMCACDIYEVIYPETC